MSGGLVASPQFLTGHFFTVGRKCKTSRIKDL